MTAKPTIAAVLGIFAGSAAAYAQAPPKEGIDAVFAEYDRAGSPGCALGVLNNGAFVYQHGYGFANLDYDLPITPASVFYVGSVSKQFTAASVVLLARQGRISLDDDIHKYIAELPDYGAPITIRELIHHTSGLRDIYTLMSLAGIRLEDVFPDEDAVALIARQKELNFPPGSDHLYSNSGYFMLAQIVKRVTGQSLRVFADENIFRPLGMTHTHFHDEPDHVLKNRVMSYMPDGNGGFRISYLGNFDKIGAGGLYTTLADLARWDANFYDPKVGGPDFLKQIHTRGVLTGGDTLAYAWGLTLGERNGLRTVRHGGSMMGFKAELLRFPDQHFSVITLCNLGTIEPSALADRVADLYLADRMKVAARSASSGGGAGAGNGSAPPATPMAPAALTPFAARYHSDELDADWMVSVRDGALVLRRRASPDLTLRHVRDDDFSAAGLDIHFVRSAMGIDALVVQAGRVRNIRFVRAR